MKKKDNIFEGDSLYTIFAIKVYKRFVDRHWFTYADVMCDFMSVGSPKELDTSVSKCSGYSELKKAFPDVLKLIQDSAGRDSVEEEGNNRSKRFRYVGKADDPLRDLANAKAISDLRQYCQFCQDSAGFFPESWLEYFFKNTRDLLDIKAKKQKGEQVLSTSIDWNLAHIDLLPQLYMEIKNKYVLSIDYKPNFNQEVCNVTFHPHYLREFNGRWFLFGHAEGLIPKDGYNIPLDRIVGKPRELYGRQYHSAPAGFYFNYFSNIVGVTHHSDAEVEEIHIRAHSFYVFKLMETKKIHISQEIIIAYGKHEDGEYGEFVVKVEVNNEFTGRLLQMGEDLEVVSPANVREMMAKKIKSMQMLYQ